MSEAPQPRNAFERKVADIFKEIGVDARYEDHSLSYLAPVYAGQCAECGSQMVGSRRKYTPDFYLPEYNLYIECKGFFKPASRALILQVLRSNPGLKLAMVFQTDNWITTKRKKRYSHWSALYGIPYCFMKQITKEWLNEITNGPTKTGL